MLDRRWPPREEACSASSAACYSTLGDSKVSSAITKAGCRVQVYIGPASDPAALEDVQRIRAEREAMRQATRLAKVARALGCAALTTQHGRVIEAITGSGFFAAGGLIGGTHAFLAYQNHLGVLWGSGETTMDLDFIVPGASTQLSKAETVDISTAIQQLNMGFVERPAQGGFVKADEREFEIDLLTNISRAAPAGSDPITIAGFNGRYQPMKFMELAFHDPVEMWVMVSDRLIKIRAPDPCDFTLHKLIVSHERKDSHPPKAAEDLVQAGCLMSALHELSPSSLETAYLGVISRGKGWRKRLESGLDRLSERIPELADCVQSLREAADEEDEEPPLQRG